MNKLIEKIVEKIECLQGQAKKGYDTYGKEAYAGKHDAYTVALNIIQEEAKAYNDCILVHTQGLDEGIYCAMCTNSMKSDRGCDGGCSVNKDMYKKVINVIKNQTVETKAYNEVKMLIISAI